MVSPQVLDQVKNWFGFLSIIPFKKYKNKMLNGFAVYVEVILFYLFIY